MSVTLADTLEDRTERRLDDMLTNYQDVQATIYSGGMGDGDGVAGMPDVWKRSGYPTLERLLVALKVGAFCLEGPALYSHLQGWYFRAARVRVPLYEWVLDSQGRPILGPDGEPKPKRNSKGKPISRLGDGGAQLYELRWRRDPLAREERVRVALAELAGAWPAQARYAPEYLREIVRRIENEKAGRRLTAA